MHTCEMPEIPYTNVSQSTIGVSCYEVVRLIPINSI